MYEIHPHIENDLSDDTKLWRYMDLARYVSMLQKKEIFLARADAMTDKWEGYFESNLGKRPSEYGEDAELMSLISPGIYHHGRKHVFLNCWHESEVESAAMWSIYDAADRGVAVQTTYGSIKSSITSDRSIYGGKVIYVDHSKKFIPEGNMYLPYLHKRLSFEHEKEWRLIASWAAGISERDEHGKAVKWGPDEPPKALHISVDLQNLIQRIYVSPNAPDWFLEVVTLLASSLGFTWPITKSDLSGDPIF
jgi:hypothetical protein